jgi:hypothetical protein
MRDKADVQRKPALSDHPGRRPLNLTINLATPSATGSHTIGINVTTPPISSRYASQSDPDIPTITRIHIASIHLKLHGRSSTASTAESVISSLNAHRIALFPFTVDYLGGLGFVTLSLLFHPASSLFLSLARHTLLSVVIPLLISRRLFALNEESSCYEG